MNIYVGNLCLEFTEGELRQEFMAFGEVVSVTIMNDKYIGSGQSRGYAFVEMPSPSEGQAAISALNGK
jgi:RNA recognition motif-containing protein